MRHMALLAALSGALTLAPAQGDVVNGDFESGLTGWTVPWGSWSAFPAAGGNHIALSEGGALRQTFDLPLGAQALEFDYSLIQSGAGGGAGPIDFVNMFLLDPGTFESLLPPADGFEGLSLFLGQDHNGRYAINPDVVNVTPGSGDDPDHVSVDVSSLPAGRSVLLEFGLFAVGGDGRTSLLAVDDVFVTVPEPATLWALCGAALLASRAGRRSG